MSATPGFSLVTASLIRDSSGHPLATGQVTFSGPLNNQGQRVSATAGGGGPITGNEVVFLVANGVITTDLYGNPPQIADTTLSYPPNIAYSVCIVDGTGQQVQGPGYGLVQPSGATWSLDSYNPYQPLLATISPGPQGPQGPGGATNPNFVVPLAAPGAAFTGDVTSTGTIADANDWLTAAPDLVRYWGAANGDVAFGVTPTGQLRASFEALPTGVVASGPDVTFPGAVYDANEYLTVPAAKPGRYWGAANGDVAFAAYSDGTTTASASASAAANLAPETPATYYSHADAGGNQQVYKAFPGSPEVQLTTQGGNVYMGMSSDGNFVVFTSTRAGAAAPYYMTKSGLHQIPITVSLPSAFDLNHHPTTGQSLALGAIGQPALTTTQPFQNIAFNIGPRLVDNNDSGALLATASIDHFVPHVEVNSASDNGGETIAAGANTCTLEMLRRGARYTVLSSINGWGGQAYVNLNKGTNPYANGIAAVSRAKAIYAAAGYASYGVRLYNVVHGEADESIGTTNYGAYMAQWQADYNADIKAITGQTLDIPHLHSQMSSGWRWSNVNSIPQQQLDACQQNPGKLVMVCPKYFLPYNNNDAHCTNLGYQWLAEYYGRVEALVAQGIEWQPFWPVNIVRWGTASPDVYVKFHVPAPPIAFDLAAVTEPTSIAGQKYGLEGYDPSGGALSIVSVTPDSKNGNDLRITFNRPLSATARLRYAFSRPTQNGNAGIAGPTGNYAGNRGNLRDCTPGLSINGNTQYNWLCHFDKLIN